MKSLDVNFRLLHISILMEHRVAGGFDKRMADDPIYCLSDKFSLHIGFPYFFVTTISYMSRPTYFLQEPKVSIIWMNEMIF